LKFTTGTLAALVEANTFGATVRTFGLFPLIFPKGLEAFERLGQLSALEKSNPLGITYSRDKPGVSSLRTSK
jgi:hypothetical protein